MRFYRQPGSMRFYRQPGYTIPTALHGTVVVRARRRLDPETVEAIEALIEAALRHMRSCSPDPSLTSPSAVFPSLAADGSLVRAADTAVATDRRATAAGAAADQLLFPSEVR